jgi:hypothetical protein
LMRQATPKPAMGEASPDAAEAVGCPRSTRRAGEPPTGGRRTRLDAACTGHSDRECQTGDSESTFLRAIASKAKRDGSVSCLSLGRKRVERRSRCGKSARRDLRGGGRATRRPTATSEVKAQLPLRSRLR